MGKLEDGGGTSSSENIRRVFPTLDRNIVYQYLLADTRALPRGWVFNVIDSLNNENCYYEGAVFL